MMTTHFTVVDNWDNDQYHHIVEGTKRDFKRMMDVTAWDILKYLRNECVGKCNTQSGDDNYFIPKLVFGNLKVSAQVNYYLWSMREDRNFSHDDHAKIVTEEEFDSRFNSVDDTIDVKIYVNDRGVACGQMKIYELANFLNEVERGDAPTIPFML